MRSLQNIQKGEFCYRHGRRCEVLEAPNADGKTLLRDVETGRQVNSLWIYLTWTTRSRRREEPTAPPAVTPPSPPVTTDGRRPFDLETHLKDWSATVREPWPATPDDQEVRKICIVGFDLNGDVRRAFTIEQTSARQFLLEEGFIEAERWRWTKTGWFEPARAALYWNAYVQEQELSPVDALRKVEAPAVDTVSPPPPAVEEVLA